MDPSIFSQLTPEQISRFMELGTLEDEAGQLEQQLAQAQALRQPQGQDYGNWAGNTLGGLGDIVRGVAGGVKQNQLRPELAGIRGKQAQGRGDILGLLGGGAPPGMEAMGGAAPDFQGPMPQAMPEAPYYAAQGGPQQRNPLLEQLMPFMFGRG